MFGVFGIFDGAGMRRGDGMKGVSVMNPSRFRMWRRMGFGAAAVAALVIFGSSPTAQSTPASKEVTFAKDIAPILQAKCQDCHRVGSMAPMSLTTYEEVRPWVRSIKERLSTHQMPPWHIDRNVGIQKFKNDMSLSDEQIETIVRWVDSGAPMGNPKDMPPPRQWPADNEWQAAKLLGRPDIV